MSKPPWSFSSLTKFETCPKQFHIVKVQKLVTEPPTVHTEWGLKVHSALEFRLKDGTPLPEEMQKWEPIATKIEQAPGELFTERKYALTCNLQPTDFFAEDCWHRGIIDVAKIAGNKAFLGDYKTGKVKSDHDQLTLSAASLMQEYPKVDSVRTAYIWLAHDKVSRKTINRDEVPVIWQEFIGRVNRLDAAYDKDRWLPKPSGLCGWCAVGREHCEFWYKRKQK